MTKEEILNKQHQVHVKELGTTNINPKDFPLAFKQAALNAMDEYAKQQSIAFAKAVLKGQWQIHSSLSGSPWLSDEQMYDQFVENQFIESQNKQ